MRVTDLEKFALEQIWRPYQTLAGINEKERLTSLPMSLDETARRLAVPSEWSDRVLDRLRHIGLPCGVARREGTVYSDAGERMPFLKIKNGRLIAKAGNIWHIIAAV